MTVAVPKRPAPPQVAVAHAPKLGKIASGVTSTRMVLNAVEGWGKTSFAAFSPNPAILMARGESGFVTLRRAGLVPDHDAVELASWKDVLRQVEQLEDSPYKTIVLDAQGGFERLCHEHVCARDFNNDWGEKGFQGFMRGYDIAVSDWLQLLQRLDRVHAKDKNVVILSHAKVKNFKNPLGPDFDRYTADVHDKIWGVTHKWADLVMFGTFLTVTQDRKGKTKGIGGTERVAYTQRTDGFDAKNRYSMPERIDIDGDAASMWGAVWTEIDKRRESQQQQQDQPAPAVPDGL